MRLSLRKVVKFTTFLILLIFLNIWISYNVNFWSFNNFEERGKVLQSWRREDDDNGGAEPSPPLEKLDIPGRLDYKLFRNEGSAKVLNSINSNEEAQSLKVQKLTSSLVPVAQKSFEENLLQHTRNSTKHLDGRKVAPYVQKGSLHIFRDKEKTTLKDIFISVKTTSKYHATRVNLILKTWYLLAREQVHFFTDGNDSNIGVVLGDHLINSNCSTDHSRRALSCKMAVEFDYYMVSRKRWFCHMDDDVYLNVPRLVEMLQGYNHKEDWYLGKPSLKHPLEVEDRETSGMKLTFWFATGGAGFCISRSLALKMAPYAGGGRFMTTAETIRLPDDCTIGYIIEHLLKHKLTVVEAFHSHLEALWLIKPHQLEKQITFSYSEYSGKQNVINVQGFSEQDDPTRFKSLHCYLFPNFRECRVLS